MRIINDFTLSIFSLILVIFLILLSSAYVYISFKFTNTPKSISEYSCSQAISTKLHQNTSKMAIYKGLPKCLHHWAMVDRDKFTNQASIL